MRSSMRLSRSTPLFRSGIDCCTVTPQRTASTTLANSTSRPPPAVLTIRPWCSAIFGSTSSLRSAFRRSSVPSQPRIPRHIGGEDRGETPGLTHVSRQPALRSPSNMWT